MYDIAVPDEFLVLIERFLQADWTGCSTKSTNKQTNKPNNKFRITNSL